MKNLKKLITVFLFGFCCFSCTSKDSSIMVANKATLLSVVDKIQVPVSKDSTVIQYGGGPGDYKLSIDLDYRDIGIDVEGKVIAKLVGTRERPIGVYFWSADESFIVMFYGETSPKNGDFGYNYLKVDERIVRVVRGN